MARRCSGEPSSEWWPVWSGSDSHMIASDGARSSTISRAEPLGHRPVAGEALLQGGAGRVVDRAAAGAVAAGRMVDPAVPVRVLEIGGAGRDVGAGDRDLAVPAQPLGQGRHVQCAAGGAAHAVGEIGMAGGAADEAVALVERHRVAEQPVPRRQAAGGDRGGAGPGGRRKDAAMRRETGAALRQFDEERRVVGADQVVPQAVADHDDDARCRRFGLGPSCCGCCSHGATPFSRWFAPSKSLTNRHTAEAAPQVGQSGSLAMRMRWKRTRKRVVDQGGCRRGCRRARATPSAPRPPATCP